MANLREIRPKLRLAMAVLVGLNVLLAGSLVYMWVHSSRALPEEFKTLRQQVMNRKSSVVAPQVVEDRVKEAREQIAHFYEDRFPNSSSVIFETLGRLATENHVKLNSASYAQTDLQVPGARQVVITAALNGDYAQTMKFINALEREKMFFIVENVQLGQQDNPGQVRLNILIQTYMRGEA
jgi:type IV pilus assembly protein PilO